MYKDVDLYNNGVERVDRRFTAVRSDGGGNLIWKGTDADSMPFTICDRI